MSWSPLTKHCSYGSAPSRRCHLAECLGFVFTARDLASARMQRLERQFSSLDERVTGGTEWMYKTI